MKYQGDGSYIKTPKQTETFPAPSRTTTDQATVTLLNCLNPHGFQSKTSTLNKLSQESRAGCRLQNKDWMTASASFRSELMEKDDKRL